jgi:actin-related protein
VAYRSNENMSQTHRAWETFFRGYGAAALGTAPERIASFYAESFIAGGPRGSAVFRNDEQFIDWLKQLHQLNKSSGMTAMTVVSITDSKSLSSRHQLVSVEWGARFEKTGERLITFEISYLLERSGDDWKIIAYISEKDQEEEMQALGLLEQSTR